MAHRTFKLTIAYDGGPFVGWQRQANGVSIQGLLESALGTLCGEAVSVAGAGRTDAGVHAIGQVASVRLETGHDEATIARAANAQLPPDVRVLAVEAMADDFHARFSAIDKTYSYRLLLGPVASPFERRYGWHMRDRLDLDAMRAAAARLIGTRDFAAFQAAGSDVATTVRTVSVSRLGPGAPAWMPRQATDAGSASGDAGHLEYVMTGDGFLRHMVRTIVGTLVEVGQGRRAPESLDDLLASRDRRRAGLTAPPGGLFLIRVRYGVPPGDGALAAQA